MTGGGGTTGTVVVSTSPTDYTPATGTRLTIRSALPYTQPTSLPAGGPFPSTAVERRFDQNVRLIQQLAEEVTRTIQLAVTSTTSGVVIPEPEASKFLRWDALANNLENADVTAGGSIGVPVTVGEGGTGADLSALAAGSLVKMNTGQTAFQAAVADTDFMKAGAKGADIASASPLVLGTDGNYFDVTGTTGFSAITVAAGRLFMLRFAAALTITHGASIDLPGATDITTAAGDRLIAFATAANTVEVLSYSRADGKAIFETISVQPEFLQFQEQQSSGVGGPSYSAGAWGTVPFNTEVQDTGSNGAVASDQIVLDDGTYEFWAFVPVHDFVGSGAQRYRLRLRDMTGGITLVSGVNSAMGYPQANYGQWNLLSLTGRFSLSVSSSLEVQIFPVAATDACQALSTGEPEIYSDIAFRKVI